MADSLRILILEDNPADAELVQFELEEAGLIFTLKVVMTEDDFICELQEFSPDLILSDYDLPKYNGALALAEAKRRHPDTPFILVTGAVTEDRAIDILTQGAKDYVLKTRLQQRLVPAVKRALAEAEEHRARRQAEEELREAHRTLEERVKIRTAELEAAMAAQKKMEEDLHESARRLTLAHQAARIGSFELNLKTGVNIWTPELEAMYGLVPGEFGNTQRSWEELVHPEDRVAAVGLVNQTFETGKPVEGEWRVVWRDGSVHWITGRFQAFKDAAGKPLRLTGVNMDITERKRTEEALQDSEKRYRRLFESAKDGILILDADTGQVDDVNPFLVQLLGYSYDELCGQHIWELGVFKDIAASKDAFKTLQDNEYVRYNDLPLETRDGQSIAVEFVSNVYLVDHHKVIQCNIRDITEQKAVELARQESEKRLRRFYESGMLGVIYWNMDGNITDANDKFLEMVGYSREELTAGRIDWVNMTPPEHRHLDEASARELKAAGVNKEPFEKEYIRKDGTRVPVLVAGAMLDEACFNGVAFALDITARKQGEAALEAHRRHLEEIVQERTAALRRSQHLLNDTQRISKVGGWEFDVSARSVFWTDEVYRIHGLAKDYDPSNPEQDIEFYAPEDRKRITDAFQRAVAQGEPYDLELQLVPAQGNRLWVRTTGQAESENGKVVRVFGNILDITETKKAQAAIQDANATLEKRVAERTEELRQSEERIRLALKNAPVSVAVQDRTLVYTWAYNQRTRRSDEIVGKTDADLFAPEDVSWILEEKRKVLETGTEMHVQHWLTSNRKRLFLDLHYEPLRDSAGEITGIGIAVVDLTEQKLAEDALQRSEERFRLMGDTIPYGAWMADAEGRNIYISPLFLELVGMTFEQVKEFGWTDKMPPEDVEPTMRRWTECVRTGREWEGELRFPSPDGRWHTILSRGKPVRDAQGQIKAWVGINLDITERKQTEEALRQSREDLERAQMVGQVGSWRLDTRRNILTWSDENHRIFGLPKGTPLSYETFLSNIHPDDRQFVDTQWQAGMRGAPYDIEHRIVVADQVKWVREKAYLEFDAAGLLLGGFGITQDITARKQAEQELRESEEKFRNLFMNMTEEVHFWKLIRDEQGRIKTWQVVDINPPTVKAWGRESREDTIGRTADEIYPGATEHFMPIVQKIMAEGIPYSYENYFPPPVDKYFHFTSIPLGEYFFTTSADITRSRKAEESLKEQAQQLEAVNKDLESFSYSVSHDLRAPLRAITGYAQMILRKGSDRFDEETRRRFETIVSNAEMMGRLIDDLLTFSRLGSQAVAKGSLKMDELIGEVWQELVTIHPDREMTLKIEQMPAAWGDRTLIRQVYSNLLGNAAKFTQCRDAVVIEAGICIRDGETVYYVRDNGVGFDMKLYDKLFGVFQRLHNEEEYKGTGIGLALVKRIINRHGGRIWAEGEVDKGATFYFTLPPPAGMMLSTSP